MALSVTIPAIDCTPTCDTLTELDDAQFYSVLINLLVENSGSTLPQINAALSPADLSAAVNVARCSLEQFGVQLPTASPQTLKALALYLAQSL